MWPWVLPKLLVALQCQLKRSVVCTGRMAPLPSMHPVCSNTIAGAQALRYSCLLKARGPNSSSHAPCQSVEASLFISDAPSKSSNMSQQSKLEEGFFWCGTPISIPTRASFSLET